METKEKGSGDFGPGNPCASVSVWKVADPLLKIGQSAEISLASTITAKSPISDKEEEYIKKRRARRRQRESAEYRKRTSAPQAARVSRGRGCETLCFNL